MSKPSFLHKNLTNDGPKLPLNGPFTVALLASASVTRCLGIRTRTEAAKPLASTKQQTTQHIYAAVIRPSFRWSISQSNRTVLSLFHCSTVSTATPEQQNRTNSDERTV